MKGQIEKRGDGVYRLRWFLGRDPVTGKRQGGSKTVRGTKRQAQQVLRDVLSRLDQGVAVPSPARLPTIQAYFDQWKAAGPDAAGVRARTFRDYCDILERHVLTRLGQGRLDAVHAIAIEHEVVKPLRDAGKIRSARLAVCALSGVYRSALKDPTYGLAGNPCLGVKVGAKPAERIEPLDATERTAFLDAVAGTPHEDLFRLLMFTGLSPHEAFALGWEHVDLGAEAVRVARTVDLKTRDLVLDTKRPARRRTVELVPDLARRLRERWLAVGRPPTGLVFHRGGRPLHLHTVRESFLRALKRAKIERRVRLYDLRHGFATAALEAGEDVRVVADLMGHSSTNTTRMVYQHVSTELKKDATNRIGQRLAGSDQ